MTGTPAGWYPDPTTPGQQRYWDGTAWTDHVAPAGPAAAPGAATVPPPDTAGVPPPGWGQPPPGVGWGSARPGAAEASAFRKVGPLGTAVAVLLGLTAVGYVFSAIARFNRWSLVGDLLDGRNVTITDIEDADNAVAAMISLTGLVTLVLGVLFIVWFHRAYRDAEALGHRDLRFSAGWAIGAWFIPVANFVIGKMMVNDVWRASDPSLAPGDPSWRDRPVAGIVNAWWALWVIGAIFSLATIGQGEVQSIADAENFRSRDMVAALASLITAAAAVTGAAAVRRLSARLDDRGRAVGAPA